MRTPAALFAAATLLAAGPAAAGEPPFEHDWRSENGGADRISRQQALPPYGHGEPAAVMSVRLMKLPPEHAPLAELVAKQLAPGPATTLADPGPIPTKTETIAGHEVTFARYRITALRGQSFEVPRLSVHAFTIDDGDLVFMNLLVAVPKLDEVAAADHRKFVEWILGGGLSGK
ncbi:MAG: hypothetical protein QM704_04500 [Anaeromyxobacteraceae bacterium]